MEQNNVNKIKRKNCPDKDEADIRADLFSLVLKGTGEGVWDLNLETKEIYFSPSWKEQLGYSDSELANTCETFDALLHPDDREKSKSALPDFLGSASETFSTLYRMRHKDGVYRWILSRGTALRDQSGRAYRVVGFHTDITGILKPHLENINYQKAILDTIKDAYIVTDRAGIVDVNSNFFDISGYTKEELIHIKLTDLIAEESIPEYHWIRDQLLKEGRVSSEIVCKRKDGNPVHVEFVATLLDDSQSTVIIIVRDITEIKNSEKSLLRYQRLLRFVIEHNRNAVAVHDKNLIYMYVSQPYIELFNLQGKEIIGKHHYEVLPQMPEHFKEYHQRALRGEIIRSKEGPSAFNPEKYVVWECRPLYEDDEHIEGFILYIEDITERKKIEELLVNEKEQFKTTLMSVADGVISTDVHGNIMVMNSIAENLTGWVFSEAKDRHINDVLNIIGEQTRSPVKDPMEQSMAWGRPIEYNNTLLISKTGKELPVEISVAPIKHGDGKISGAVFIVRDVSEKRAEQRKIEYLSYHDELTLLYNRRYIEEARKILDTPENLPLTIFSIDVDGLKLANDAFGHEYGDRLLKKVAKILNRVCRPEDIIGRVGGDEFSILMKKTDERDAALIEKKIQKEVAALKFYPIVASLAIGFAVKHSPEDDIKTVVALSDHFMYQNKIKSSKAMKSKTIQMVLSHNYSISKYERSHTENVSRYCEVIARAMNMYDKAVQDIKTTGLLHDIGKIMIPSHIINKPGKLSKDEMDLVKRHSEIGYQLLRSVDDYAHISKYVLYHHENWDGSGYPTGLRGEKIPLFSRIIAVADAFEAMTADRPYRKRKTVQEAVEELKKGAGKKFDPKIVKLFIENVIPSL
jgi:diguanylate cyclase (GGDEF)-like protein/PAS domain S-box-containing protein